MPVPVAALGASAVIPVLMLVGGLAVLVVGLVLLTGGRRAARTEWPADTEQSYGSSARPAAWTSSDGSPAASNSTSDGVATAPASSQAAATTAGPADEPEPACDWSAWLEAEDGDRVQLRAPLGRACCTYVVRVRDLDPVPSPMDELDKSLVWAGAATRIGPEGATTPLERDVVTRRATSLAGGVFAALSLDRSAGPEVTTPAWRELPPSRLGSAGSPDHRAAQLWSLHIDELRDHGARPVPADGPRVAPLVHRRRVEATVAVQRGCQPAPHVTEVEGTCRARLRGSVTPAAAQLAAPLLASWITVDGTVVAADEPTAPALGVSRWQRRVTVPATGIAAVCEPGASSIRGEWAGQVRTDVDERWATMVLGSAVELEVDTDDHGPARIAAELHATTLAHARLHLGGAAGGGPTAGCRRCLPHLEVVIGRSDTHGVRPITPSSTGEAEIRLDGRPLRLRPPDPGSGTRSWTVEPGDVEAQGPRRVSSTR